MWVYFFKNVLETNLGEAMHAPTESESKIREMDKTDGWKLKGIVA
jgi:hypothetical protein